MKTKARNNTDERSEHTAIDKLDEMWDRKLAKGDDEFFESFRKDRSGTNKESERKQQGSSRTRRRPM